MTIIPNPFTDEPKPNDLTDTKRLGCINVETAVFCKTSWLFNSFCFSPGFKIPNTCIWYMYMILYDNLVISFGRLSMNVNFLKCCRQPIIAS